MKCMQGLNIGVPMEDIIEFFNEIDSKNENIITKI